MRLVEVTDEETAKDFLRVPIILYGNDTSWIRPLDRDIEQVFDPRENKLLRRGECVRWVLDDAEGTLIGRIAAFVNPE